MDKIRLIDQLTDEEFTKAEFLVKKILSQEATVSLQLLESERHHQEVVYSDHYLEFRNILIDSFTYFLSAKLTFEVKNDFNEAAKLMEMAAQGFELVSFGEFRFASEGFYFFYSAIGDMNNLNVHAGHEKLRLAKERFAIGQDHSFDAWITSLEALAKLFAGIAHIQMLEYKQGTLELKEAAKFFKIIAVKFTEKESFEYYQNLGSCYFCLTLGDFGTTYMQLGDFDFEAFLDQTSNKNKVKNAQETIRSLSKIMDEFALAKTNMALAKGYSLLIRVMQNIGRTMYYMISGKGEKVLLDITESKVFIENAKVILDSVDTIGNMNVLYVRTCENIETKLDAIKNILIEKKLAKFDGFDFTNITYAVQNLIKRGKSIEAIDYLIENGINADIFEECIVLRQKYIWLIRQESRDVITIEESNLERNKIANSVLKILEIIQLTTN